MKARIWNHRSWIGETDSHWLRERFEIISLVEAQQRMASTENRTAALCITFDDGYADNWVYAYPILKKHGHRAAIWLSTDFVDPRREPRATCPGVGR